MLVLLSGVTGVGKTTIIKELVVKHGWNSIVTYMTRLQRVGENDKVSLCQNEFDKKNNSGDFFCVDKLFGNYYAVLKSSIDIASSDYEDVWVIDRPISLVHTYKSIIHIHIILLPEYEQQLVNQIAKCGRTSRLDETIVDFRKNYEPYYKKNTAHNILVVTNYENMHNKTAELIYTFTKKVMMSYQNTT